jgi:hypothetical protein
MSLAKLDQQLAALATMSSAQLRAEWVRVYRTPAPPLSADLLARGIAWRLQERVHGGLTKAHLRELRRYKTRLDAAGNVSTNVNAGRIKPGSRIVREWGGSTHHVLVLDDSYHYQDRSYTSLTQIAREITGTHWSGPRFFGLRKSGAANA